jgi:hypothetical protein
MFQGQKTITFEAKIFHVVILQKHNYKSTEAVDKDIIYSNINISNKKYM